MLECNFLILRSQKLTSITLFKWVNTLTDTILQCKGVENEFLLLVLGSHAELEVYHVYKNALYLKQNKTNT